MHASVDVRQSACSRRQWPSECTQPSVFATWADFSSTCRRLTGSIRTRQVHASVTHGAIAQPGHLRQSEPDFRQLLARARRRQRGRFGPGAPNQVGDPLFHGAPPLPCLQGPACCGPQLAEVGRPWLSNTTGFRNSRSSARKRLAVRQRASKGLSVWLHLRCQPMPALLDKRRLSFEAAYWKR